MGLLVMNEKERQYKALLEMVKLKKLTLKLASQQLGISYRQAKRMYKRYQLKGDAGLVHKARGRISNRRCSHRDAIIARYKERYEGFGPTLAAEYLAEDNLVIDHETLRRLLLLNHLWARQRKRAPYRRQRECRAQFGELVQIDGSIHDWFEDGGHRCLLNMVDDATSKTHALMDSGETTRCIFRVIWQWIERYGIPLAFYVDLKNVYISPKNTSFGFLEKACKKLGIKLIKAYSPQAKGRVERNHGVYQDRFVKELRLKKIKTIEEANAVLGNGFIDKLNQKFEKPARNPQSAHRSLGTIDLNQILCWEYTRTVQNDWTFSFMSDCYQIERENSNVIKPPNKILVRQHLDGTTSAWYNDKSLVITRLAKRPKSLAEQKSSVVPMSASAAGKIGRYRSPWSKFNPDFFKKTGT